MQVFSRRTAGALQVAVRRQGYSTATSGYAATAENLRINKDTKVIFQGFTGKQGRFVIEDSNSALVSANSRTAFTPSRPLITVSTTSRYGTEQGLIAYRNQCCRWYKPKESRRNTSGEASVCQSQRCYQRNGSNCIRDLCPVRNPSQSSLSMLCARLGLLLTAYQTATGRCRYRGSYRSRDASCCLHYRRNSPA